MKVYVDELPKICKDCHCLNKVNGRCQLLHIYVDEDKKQEDCLLESIADHDKKVRAEAVAENQALKARWEKLKEWVKEELEKNKDLACTAWYNADEEFLAKMKELEKECKKNK